MENRSNLYNFLKSKGFKLVDHDTSEYFGDYYDTFSNDAFELRFISSKSIVSIDIRSINDQWYDLALVKALLNSEEVLNKVTTAEEYFEFTVDKLSRINELFIKENYLATKRSLDELGNKRVKQMFPNMGGIT